MNKNLPSIFNSIKADISALSSDIVEAELDQYFEDGFLKEIPIIGTAFKVLNIGKKISDAFFVRKIMKFLFRLKDIPIEEREKFTKKLEKEKQRKKVDEKLLISLNQFDDAQKASILGTLFKAYIEGNIDQDLFFRISFAVEKIYIQDLVYFLKARVAGGVSDTRKGALIPFGIFETSIQTENTTNQRRMSPADRLDAVEIKVKIIYQVTSIGRLLYKFGGPVD